MTCDFIISVLLDQYLHKTCVPNFNWHMSAQELGFYVRAISYKIKYQIQIMHSHQTIEVRSKDSSLILLITIIYETVTLTP